MHMFRKRSCRIALLLAEIVVKFLTALLGINIYLDIKEPFIFCTQDRKKTMRSDSLQRFGIIKIRLVFHCLGTCGLLCSLGHDTSGLEYLSERLTDGRCLAQTLSYDVTCTGKSIIDGRHLRADKSTGFRHRINKRHIVHLVCKRLQTCLLGRCSAGSAFRFEWEIEILHLTGFDTVLNLDLQLRSKPPGLTDGLKNCCLALLEFRKCICPVSDLCHCDLVKASCPFLTITTDERNRSTLFKKLCAILYLPFLDPNTVSNSLYIDVLHILIM